MSCCGCSGVSEAAEARAGGHAAAHGACSTQCQFNKIASREVTRAAALHSMMPQGTPERVGGSRRSRAHCITCCVFTAVPIDSSADTCSIMCLAYVWTRALLWRCSGAVVVTDQPVILWTLVRCACVSPKTQQLAQLCQQIMLRHRALACIRSEVIMKQAEPGCKL